MNESLLTAEIREYLLEHEFVNSNDFALRKHPFKGVTTKELTQQLVGLQKSKKKLPTWYANKQILFPPKLNLEQTSSEKAAAYKASLVSGSKMIDVTGGFGIDSYFFAQQISALQHCELNVDLHALAAHNFKVLGVENITSICGDGVEALRQQSDLDWVYIDPSRRNTTKGKVFLLEDCLPNVVDMIDFIFNHSQSILIKTAPIYDITEGLRVLENVKEIHIVAVDNEVKELLWVLEKDFEGEICFIPTSIEKKETYSYTVPCFELKNSQAIYGEVGTYLYEPFAVFMKLGGFDWVSKNFELEKIHTMSHLYTNDEFIRFPGKAFKVEEVLPYNKASVKQLSGKRASVVTRNFKINATDLRKKMKLKEDDKRFLFFTTNVHNKQIIVDAKRIF